MSRFFVFCGVCVGLSLASGVPLRAQLSTMIQRSSHVTDSAAVVAASTKADTGRMMPGYRDLSSYNTPGYCLVGLERVEYLLWRTRDRDTVERFSTGDSLTTAARQLGRTCMSSLTPQHVSPLELGNFMRLAVAVGDTAMLRAVVDQQLSIATDDRTRGLVLRDVIAALLEARPQQEQLAEDFFKRFTSLGPDAKLAGLAAYGLFYSRAAWMRYDTSEMLRVSHERQALAAAIPREVREAKGISLGTVFLDSIEIVLYKQIPDLQATVERLIEQGTADVSAQAAMSIRANYQNIALIGKPLRGLSGIAWFPDSVDLHGKVSLVMPCLGPDMGGVSPMLSRYRRVYEQYKDRGFQVVLVCKTKGFLWRSPPLDPNDEARSVAWYYREHLRLPFTVVVEETPFEKIPDGRRFGGLTAFLRQFDNGFGGAIIGRDGNIIRAGMQYASDAMLRAWVELALRDRR